MSSMDDPEERPAPGRRGPGRRRSRRGQPHRPSSETDQPTRGPTDLSSFRDPARPPAPDPPIRGVGEPASEDDAAPDGRASTSTVRPYVLTRGRTRSRWHLGWETLVSIGRRDTAPPVPEPIFDEEVRAVELCASPRSVAEVAAHLKIPVGVTRVVLGDLAERRIIVVHDTGDAADPEILRRIIRRLRES